MPSEVEELVEFLTAKRAEVKAAALDIVQGLTGTPEGVEKLTADLTRLCAALLRLLGDAPDVSKKALVSLVNLSQHADVATALLESNTVGRTMDYLREKSCPHVQLMVMLLANLTVSHQGSADLLQLTKPGMEGLHMASLLKMFVISGATCGEGEADPMEHMANIMTNVTQIRKGRVMLLEPGRGLLHALAAQLQAPSLVRRRGCSGAIRNCCLTAEEDGTLGHILADVEVWRRVLVPLSGREALKGDVVVREHLAEAVMALAHSQQGREVLRQLDGQVLLQKGYEYEEHPPVCAAMEQVARLLMFEDRDEEAEEEGVEKGCSSLDTL